MAQQDLVKSISLKASGDLSGKQYLFIALDANGKAAVASSDAAAVGVQQNKPTAADMATEVAILGTTKVIAAGAISIGADVVSNAAGKAVARATEHNVMGMALGAAAADGDIIEVLLRPLYK